MSALRVEAGFFLSLAFLLPVPAGRLLGQKTAVEIRVGIVVQQTLEVRPVPLTKFEVSGLGGRRDTLATSLGGSFLVDLAPGPYRIRALSPVSLQGSNYSWDLDVVVPKAAKFVLELTNANATPSPVNRTTTVADGSGMDGPRAASLGPQELFLKSRGAVVRVEAGLGHGTGFIVEDPDGGILTNDHVVAGARDVTVVLDSVTRVSATVVLRDRAADVALLRIHPQYLIGRARLRLASPNDGTAILAPGQTVYALGYPLNQEQTFTSGIVSGVRQGAITSDVKIDPGNSGGPMIDHFGTVVGINTFRDVAGGERGISGAIAINQVLSFLRTATAAFPQSAVPSAVRLPTMPTARIPADALRRMADQADPKAYGDIYKGADAGNFEVVVTSPISRPVLESAAAEYAATDRRKREDRAAVSKEERFEGSASAYEWGQYVGDDLTPVVTINVSPKYGETGGSLFKRVMLGPNLQATLRFKGDVRGVELFRDGLPVAAIRSGSAPQVVLVENRWVEMRDVANAGRLVLDARTFAPRDDGTIPQIVLAIDDLNKPNQRFCFAFYPEYTAKIWNDFFPLAGDIWPGERLQAGSYPQSGRRKIDAAKSPKSCGKASGGGSWEY